MSGTTNQAPETNCDKFVLAMHSLVQSMLVAMVGLGLLAPADNFAQSPSPSPNASVLLEVIATHTTMASEDRYVYLRVFSDSTAESAFKAQQFREKGTARRQEGADSRRVHPD